jgi:hypothetical protein
MNLRDIRRYLEARAVTAPVIGPLKLYLYTVHKHLELPTLLLHRQATKESVIEYINQCY